MARVFHADIVCDCCGHVISRFDRSGFSLSAWYQELDTEESWDVGLPRPEHPWKDGGELWDYCWRCVPRKDCKHDALPVYMREM